MTVTSADLIARLEQAFPREKVSAQRMGLLLAEVADIPPAALEAAVQDAIRRSEFFPSIAALRNAAAEWMLGLPREPDALAQVEVRMAWARRPEAERSSDPPEVHPLVREALDRVGGWHAFRATDEAGVVRGQFMRIYRELRAGAIEGAQIGGMDALPAPPSRGQLTSPRDPSD